MLNKNVLKYFVTIWKLFEGKFIEAGGSAFLIDPFEQYFSIDFVNSLNSENAKTMFHTKLAEWGKLEQNEHEIEYFNEPIYDDNGPTGESFKMSKFKDSSVLEGRRFIISAFYNLCCLAMRKYTIEELIFLANGGDLGLKEQPDSLKAFYFLLGISNSFLLSDWAKSIFTTAISNSDNTVFQDIQKWLLENTPQKRFSVAKRWLGTTMLWYLGGKDMKRRDFMMLLRQYELISPEQDEKSFNAELSKLRLIKDFDITQ